MDLATFKTQLHTNPNSIEFDDTISVIDLLYHFEAGEFSNGELVNSPGQNSGSCKLFAFAQLQNFNTNETLACFGRYYREDVLANPDADNHQNIRNFIKTGWDGIKFKSTVLSKKS
ncbi:Type III effector HopPmaJ [hydrothermal vent metagenome]|uniref:Type III effector HopPmaJ n=1 Tax=hydrothermal vent metagenome TaxID=652676 RepID=A0A3B0ZDZ7_9ZZZZ